MPKLSNEIENKPSREELARLRTLRLSGGSSSPVIAGGGSSSSSPAAGGSSSPVADGSSSPVITGGSSSPVITGGSSSSVADGSSSPAAGGSSGGGSKRKFIDLVKPAESFIDLTNEPISPPDSPEQYHYMEPYFARVRAELGIAPASAPAPAPAPAKSHEDKLTEGLQKFKDQAEKVRKLREAGKRSAAGGAAATQTPVPAPAPAPAPARREDAKRSAEGGVAPAAKKQCVAPFLHDYLREKAEREAIATAPTPEEEEDDDEVSSNHM